MTLDQRSMQQVIGYRLRRAQLIVFKGFYEAFSELELRPAEFAVLALIADNPGRKQAEIAAALGIKRANFVAIINGLAERGLVERRQKANDRRSHALFLTDGGREFSVRMNEIQQELERDLVARLGGPEERDKLIALLDRIGV
ncbi:MAG TPA: MarR family transcriptional regulator [Devosiaceae bacterium]|jgi:DNA-binding MarR family transcriptional regulator|nr:MarR family transcriptional regulator [Devosiaceae bacterium]